MSWLYERVLRPVLFTQDPEAAHERALAALRQVAGFARLRQGLAALCQAPPLPVKLFGLDFPNPIGLAAGMDKAARALPAWETLGFGFVELGTVTGLGQPGNPPPRLFRVVRERALINRMGFNNPGAESVGIELANWRVRHLWPGIPVALNLGKSKVTPLAEAAADYALSARFLWPYADFFVVNVSSPNTPNLRQLQDKPALDEVLAALQEVNFDLARRAHGKPRPVLVKVAPDLAFDALDDILTLVEPRQLAGLVATNTTIGRPAAGDPESQGLYSEAGGLSGRPLRQRSTEVIRHLWRQSAGRVPLIGVGGIFDADDAWEKITAGASLVELYTGFVYGGPQCARRIVQGLHAKVRAAGLSSLTQAVGMAARA